MSIGKVVRTERLSPRSGEEMNATKLSWGIFVTWPTQDKLPNDDFKER
jgi:hypothetical protein